MSREKRLDLFEWYDSATDLLQCLECKRWVSTVPAHLKSHKMSSDEYRERWGIFKTTPLSSKEFIRSRRENMLKLRQKGKATVSKKGVAPKQLKGLTYHGTKTEYKEFDAARKATSQRHKGKILSAETKIKLSQALSGREAHNKIEPVTRYCKRDGKSFVCMRWQSNKFCSKSCAMLVNQNWLKRKALR